MVDPARDVRDSVAESQLAERAADMADRIQRGEQVDFESCEASQDTGRDLLPTIKFLTAIRVPESIEPRPSRLGDFQIIREVGRGGMGVVYEAIQLTLGRRVALKVLLDSVGPDPRLVQRFQVEAQAAASLHHPNIVPVYATGTDQGLSFYAMQYIEGRDLARVLRDASTERPTQAGRALTPGQSAWTPRGADYRLIADLVRQAALALDHAHQNGVLHRDVKPSNLLIDGAGHLWISDFGLARMRGETELTRTGVAIGTPRYMSPEQARGRKVTLDGRTDVYALGATLYELLTLQPAFEGEDQVELLRRIIEEAPTPPRRLDARIPVDLETIVLKTMAKEPKDRYATAAELADDLKRFLEERPIRARRPTYPELAAKWCRRHRGPVVAGLVGMIVLISGALVSVHAYLDQRTRHDAELKKEQARFEERAERQRAAARSTAQQFHAQQLRLAGVAVRAREFEKAQDHLDTLVSGEIDEDLRGFAWRYLNRESRRELVRLPPRPARCSGVSISEKAQTLAVVYDDSFAEIWDLRTESQVGGFPVDSNNPKLPALNSDGSNLAFEAFGPRHCLDLWDVANQRLLFRWELDRPRETANPRPPVFTACDKLILVERYREYWWRRGWDIGLDNPSPRPFDSRDDLRAVAISTSTASVTAWSTDKVSQCDLGTMKTTRGVNVPTTAASPLAVTANSQEFAITLPDEGSLAVYMVRTGAVMAKYPIERRLARLEFSPDAKTLAGVDESNVVHLWNRETRQEKAFRPYPTELRPGEVEILFSPDSERLATYTTGDGVDIKNDFPVTVFHVATGEPIARMPSHDFLIRHPAFTSDSRSLVMNGRSARIWHFDSLLDTTQPAGHKDEAWSAAFTNDGKLLATGSDDTDEPETIKLWDPVTGKLIKGWNGGLGTVASLAFSPDGTILVSGHLTPTDNVRFWNVATAELLQTLSGHTENVRAVALSPDASVLASGSYDRTIRLWRMPEGKELDVLTGHVGQVHNLAFSHDGRTLISGGNDPALRFWDVESGTLIHGSATGPSGSPVVSPDGGLLATCGDNLPFMLWDLATRRPMVELAYTGSRQRRLAFAPDGRTLASVDTLGWIRLWDIPTRQEIFTLQEQSPAQVNALVFSPDGSCFVTCAHDGRVSIIRADRANAP